MGMIARKKRIMMSGVRQEKNLFKIDVPFQNPDNTTVSNSTKRKFAEHTYCYGIAWSNYMITGQVTSYSIVNGVLSVTNNNVYGVVFPFKLIPGKTYKLTADIIITSRLDYAFYDSDGTWISAQQNKFGVDVTIPNNADITILIFYSSMQGTAATFGNISLELVA